jgi:hypothetical protein
MYVIPAVPKTKTLKKQIPPYSIWGGLAPAHAGLQRRRQRRIWTLSIL